MMQERIILRIKRRTDPKDLLALTIYVPIDTSYNVVVTLPLYVALTLPYSCNGTLQKQRRCNVSLRNVIMRHCNNVVFATSSDISIATIWQLHSDVK